MLCKRFSNKTKATVEKHIKRSINSRIAVNDKWNWVSFW